MADSRRSSVSTSWSHGISGSASPAPTPVQSRLQRRRPASLQISSPAPWNAAIPLLSPLSASPGAAEICKPSSNIPAAEVAGGEKQAPVVFKKWQHPAAPFCYEQAGGGSFKPSFSVPCSRRCT